MSAWIDGLTAFIGAHPHWAGVLVFLIAASEAIVVIGYIIPGTAILLAIGGIAGLGHLPLLPILVWAAFGAIAGDGFSYWLGHTYREELRRRWPFSRYPDLIERGEVFFHRHGSKSVFLGRFVPLLKPIIPTVAGILGMPPAKFYVANIISAFLWSPAHILPGVLVGASLGLLHGVSSRLVVLALGALAVAAVLVWSARLAVLRLAPLMNRAHRRAFEWATARPGTLAQRLAAPFDPDHPGTPALAVSLLVLLAASVTFAGVVEDLLSGDPLVEADRAISHFASGLRNPWMDPAMVVVTALGDAAVTVPLALALLGWLFAVGATGLARAVLIALAATAAAVVALKTLLHVPATAASASGFDALAFPSGHVAMTAVLFGLLAWLLTSTAPPRARTLAHAAAFGWAIVVALSRVYLGTSAPTDVLGGLLLAVLVCATVFVLYRHEPRARVHPLRLASGFAVVFLAAGLWHVTDSYATQLARYQPKVATVTLAAAEWRDHAWQSLPPYRIDLAGEREEPLSLQWFGHAASLETRLLASGWRRPPPWTLSNSMGFLKPATSIDELPAAAALHDGRKPVVVLVHDTGTAGERWVLRAWPSGVEITSAGQQRPLLLGALVKQHETHPASLLTVPRRAVPATPPGTLLDSLGGQIRVRASGERVRLADDAEAPTTPSPAPG